MAGIFGSTPSGISIPSMGGGAMGAAPGMPNLFSGNSFASFSNPFMPAILQALGLPQLGASGGNPNPQQIGHSQLPQYGLPRLQQLNPVDPGQTNRLTAYASPLEFNPQ